MIEEELFERTKVDFDKLVLYGFVKKDGVYQYSKVFHDNFKAELTVDAKGVLTGKVYDLNIEEEYINFRIESQVGEFVSGVRQSYKELLEDIKDKCFKKEYFVYDQANRITEKIIEKYHDRPIFPWEVATGHGVFKNPANDKWYALIMYVERCKIDKSTTEKVEAINVKLPSEKIARLVKEKGFYPAYHMNKKHWLTIILDDTLKDSEIMKYIEESHQFTETSSSWIIPANPKYFDVIAHFEQESTILWKQPKGIKEKDHIYLYLGSPYSAILYQCEVIEIDVPYQYQDKNLTIKKAMRLKLVKRYKKDDYTFSKLKKYGVTSIRGARHLPEELERELNR